MKMKPAYGYGNVRQARGSGHEAGWQWAEDHGITDESECGGSGSFHDGCVMYVQAQKKDDGENT